MDTGHSKLDIIFHRLFWIDLVKIEDIFVSNPDTNVNLASDLDMLVFNPPDPLECIVKVLLTGFDTFFCS